MLFYEIFVFPVAPQTKCISFLNGDTHEVSPGRSLEQKNKSPAKMQHDFSCKNEKIMLINTIAFL